MKPKIGIPKVLDTNGKISHNCVRYVACSTGERDVSIQIIARTNSEAYAFVTDVIATLPGVRKTSTSIVP